MRYELWITAVAFFALGMLLGMVIQQGILQSTLVKVASNLEGVEINIDVNETQIMEGAKEISEDMVDKMIESLNNTEEIE